MKTGQIYEERQYILLDQLIHLEKTNQLLSTHCSQILQCS